MMVFLGVVLILMSTFICEVLERAKLWDRSIYRKTDWLVLAPFLAGVTLLFCALYHFCVKYLI